MKNNFILLKKIVFISILIIILNIKSTYSEVIKKIEVNGNDRLAKETIILFSELNLNEETFSEDLNNAFKKLYDTDYFKDVKINFSNGY